MKAARLACAILCVALLRSTGYADQQTRDEPKDKNVEDDAVKTSKPDRGHQMKAGLRKQIANRPVRASSSTSIRSRALERSSPAGGLHETETASASHGAPEFVRPRATVRGPTSLLSDTRHRGLNPAVISGSANPLKRNTAVIDGRQIHRQP